MVVGYCCEVFVCGVLWLVVGLFCGLQVVGCWFIGGFLVVLLGLWFVSVVVVVCLLLFHGFACGWVWVGLVGCLFMDCDCCFVGFLFALRIVLVFGYALVIWCGWFGGLVDCAAVRVG